MKNSLNGTWLLENNELDIKCNGTVPGSMYLDLLTNQLIEDPFYRENEQDALKLSYKDYTYSRNFDVDEQLLSHQKVVLVCEGLDTLSSVYINNHLIAQTNNMHRRYEFDVKDYLVVSQNDIRIEFDAPAKYVEDQHAIKPICKGKDSLQGIYYLRKAHSMFGWDWGPKLPDVGIWRDIYLEGVDEVKVEDIIINQIHYDNKVDLEFIIKNEWIIKRNDFTFEIVLNSPQGKSRVVKGQYTGQEITTTLTIDDPELWWPNNFGEPSLYSVAIRIISPSAVVYQNELKYGLRTIDIKQEPDQWGESFEVVVNGLPIFLMGADFIPEDSILSRRSAEKTGHLLEQCIEANFNCVRVWGGGYYPDDSFYDKCDELGLLVWQDFMFACRLYDLTDEFVDNIKQEFRDNIRRLRHHASLAMWCGNNEIEWGLSDDWLPDTPKNRRDYLRQYHEIIPSVLKEEDPTRFYWPSSPSSKGDFTDPNIDHIGDMHYWGVWHENKPFTDYRNYYPRFMSEFGLQSFPCLKTLESVTIEEDRNIFSPVMENHQKNKSCNGKILHYISENYRYPKDFESLLYVSQLIQAEGIKYGVEHWRRHRGRCMGAIYWQLNDCWQVASWASIDYEGRWKALHYYAKKFFAPVLISAHEEETNVSLHLTNETKEKISGVYSWQFCKLDGTVVSSGKEAIVTDALTATELIDLDFKMYLSNEMERRNYYLSYDFEVDGKVVSENTVVFTKFKTLELKKGTISFELLEYEESYSIIISSDTFSKYVQVDLKYDDFVCSDNFFDLLPNKQKVIEISKNKLLKPLTYEELLSQLKITSLIDSF